MHAMKHTGIEHLLNEFKMPFLILLYTDYSYTYFDGIGNFNCIPIFLSIKIVTKIYKNILLGFVVKNQLQVLLVLGFFTIVDSN